MVHEINSLRQPGGTDGSGWYSRWPSLSPVGGHPAFKPWCKCLRCQDANEIANKIVNFQNKKDFCIGTGTCRRAGGRDGARTSPAAPQGFTPRAALGNLTERHPCCCKRLPNLFIKNCKEVPLITTLGPLPLVKGIRESWFLMFLPSSQRWHWKPEMGNPFCTHRQ